MTSSPKAPLSRSCSELPKVGYVSSFPGGYNLAMKWSITPANWEWFFRIWCFRSPTKLRRFAAKKKSDNLKGERIKWQTENFKLGWFSMFWVRVYPTPKMTPRNCLEAGFQTDKNLTTFLFLALWEVNGSVQNWRRTLVGVIVYN